MVMLKKVKATKVLKEILSSFFLFTITIDVLSGMMLKAKEKGLLEGFLIGRSIVKVSHLQFVDDIIFFLTINMEELQNLKVILIVFGRILRLHINVNKSIV